MYYKIHSVDVGPLLGIVANVDSGDVTILFHNTNEFKFSVCSSIAAPPVALFTYNRSEQQVPLRLLSASTSMVGSCHVDFSLRSLLLMFVFVGLILRDWVVGDISTGELCNGRYKGVNFLATMAVLCTRRGVGGGVDGLQSNFSSIIFFPTTRTQTADGPLSTRQRGRWCFYYLW